jgi:hypothetical protein
MRRGAYMEAQVRHIKKKYEKLCVRPFGTMTIFACF